MRSPKTSETILEINLTALRHNYHYLKSKLKEGTKMLGVVKAYGYGSDDISIAKELEALGIDYLAVAYASEGESLRIKSIKTPILVLHPLPINFNTILERCLEPSIYSQKMLREFIKFAENKKQKHYPIHLKFNTGLNRLGFNEADIHFIVELLSATDSVRVVSIFSHLAASEDLGERFFTENQIDKFRGIAELIINELGYSPILHTVNTSGILNYPQAHFDMVRTGIGLYGFGNDLEANKNLRPVVTLRTVISQIHVLKKGDNVGYNMGFKADKEIRSATLPIGHADGINRAYGHGKGWVTINGKKAPILGNVCMDMIMVDVTSIACEEGDEAIVFGEHSTAEDLSFSINSIPYELLAAISQRIKRIVRQD